MEDKDHKDLEGTEQGEKKEGAEGSEIKETTETIEPANTEEQSEVTQSEASSDVIEESQDADTADQERAALLGEDQVEVNDQTGEEATERAEATASTQEGTPVEQLNSNSSQPYSWQSSENPVSSNSNKVWPIVSLVLAILLVLVFFKPLLGNGSSTTVATVNGTKITKDNLYDKLVETGGEAALDELIHNELLDQEVKKAKVTVTKEEIDKEYQGILESIGSKELMQQQLAAAGMTEEDLHTNIESNLKMTKLLQPEIKITDEEIKEIFDTYNDSFNTPEQVRTSVIVVEKEDEAKEVLKQLKDGADFAELAKSKSLDEHTKNLGGDTGFLAQGQMDPAVEAVAFKLKKDELSDVIKTSEGFEIIKLTDHKEKHTATLEEKTDEIRKGLTAQKVSELLPTWFNEVKENAKITNTLTDKKNEDTTETDSK